MAGQEATEERSFHGIDYVTFVAMLLMSAVIGLGFSWKKRTGSAGAIFVGGRQMSLLPVALSSFATFTSAIAILGLPAEVYYNGITYCYIDIAEILPNLLNIFVLVPFFYRLECVSIYEYLRKRFDGRVSTLVALTFQLGLFFYMAVALYAPSSAFSKISGIPLWVTIPCVGALCTVYTAFGGLQGVMWTDVWQSLFMFAGLLALIIVGTINVGGADKVIEAAKHGGRLNFLIDSAPNPTVRHNFLSVVIGGALYKLSMQTTQPIFQRYVSCKSLRTAQQAAFFAYAASLSFNMLVYAVGLVAFAYFSCDPLESGQISKTEQLVTYTVLRTMNVPGVVGLFMACTFSGSLSTISSGINSMSAVFMVDLVIPLRRLLGRSELCGRTVAVHSKIISLTIGVLMVIMAFVCDRSTSLISQISLSIGGVTSGPCLGLTLAAVFLPIVNATGAMFGFVVSISFVLTIWVGSIVTGITSYAPKLPLSVHGCTSLNSTNITMGAVSSTNGFGISNNTSGNFTIWSNNASFSQTGGNFDAFPSSSSVTAETGLVDIFRISYLLYCLLSTSLCLVVAILVSLCTNCDRQSSIDSNLYFSFRRKTSAIKSQPFTSLESNVNPSKPLFEEAIF